MLTSADFSKELTTAVMWLNDRGLDIQCVRLKPYLDGDRILLDVQRIIPLPEAEQYQVRIRQKSQEERDAKSGRWTKDAYLKDVESRFGIAGVELTTKTLDWISPKVDNVWWGRGQRVGSFTPVLECGEMRRHWYQMFSLYSDGWLFIEGAVLRKKEACEDGVALDQLIQDLRSVDGMTAQHGIDGRITIPPRSLTNPDAWEAFRMAIERFLDHITQAYPDHDTPKSKES